MSEKKTEGEPGYPYRAFVKIAVVSLLLLLGAASLESYRDLSLTRSREAEFSERLAATQLRIQNLEGRLERIKNDPMTLEQLAREELGWVRENDMVIVLPEE